MTRYTRYKRWRPRLIDPDDPMTIKVLKVVGVVGLVAVASFLSPTFLANLVYKYLKYKLKQSISKRQVFDTVVYLKRKKFISYSAEKQQVSVTKLGKNRLSEYEFQKIKIKPTAWDGQWRFITFDIPEEKAGLRHTFRRKLKELGFFHFQRSVFLLPFPCEKEISQICEYLKISSYVHLIHASRFPTDVPLIKKFNLEIPPAS